MSQAKDKDGLIKRGPRQTFAAALLAASLLPMWPMVTQAGTIVRSSAFDYDALGFISKEIIEPTDSDLCVVNVYSYDNFGNRTNATVRNCNGSVGSAAPDNSEAAAPTAANKAPFNSRSASTDYGTAGLFPLTTTNALGQSETKTFDARLGTVTSLTGPNGLTTYWVYDDLGRKVLEQRADGNGTRWTYEYCSSLTVNNVPGSATCPTIAGAVGTYVITTTPVKAANAANNTNGAANGPYNKVYYDALGRAIRNETQGFDGTAAGGTTTAPLIYQDTEYNALGQVARSSRPYLSTASSTSVQWTSYTYDKLGRVIQETAPDASVNKIEYSGLTVKTTNAKNQTRTEARDVAGQLTTVTDTYGKVLSRSYDAMGTLVKTTDALGNVTTLVYDAKGIRKRQMVDPDMGTWTYTYNAVGDLLEQTDAKGQLTTMSYDLLGRLIAKSEPSLNANWYYDKYKDNSACSMGVGKLCEVSADNGYARKHGYDSLGRANSTTTTVAGTAYISNTVYYDSSDTNAGRVKSVSYPTGALSGYTYTPLGYLQKVSVTANGSTAVYWQGQSMDAEGHLLKQSYGNGVVTDTAFDPQTGRVKTIQAGTTTSYAVQNASYSYDSIGNLSAQSDAATGLSATYTYDDLNRLLSETRLGSAYTTGQTTSWTYDDIGNIKTRSDVGTYAYPGSGASSVRPHALSSISGTVNGVSNPTYSYDANGNLMTSAGRTITWTSFNKVNTATRGNNTLAYWYDAEGERVKETSSVSGSVQKTTIYLNPGAGAGLFYEEDITSSTTKKKHYISAGSGTIGVLTLDTTANSWTMQYWHKDNLGSNVAVTDAVAGAVTERMTYEPFGKRRNVNGTNDGLGTLTATTTERGFTGHEMMDEVGLVNMNGRVYDPAIGRFLSADPYIQSPDNLQSYNRYAYVWNNPLNATDPTGFWSLSRLVKAQWRFTRSPSFKNYFAVVRAEPGSKYVKGMAMSAVCSFFTAGSGTAACVAASTAILEKAYGASTKDALRAGIVSGATALAFEKVGDTWSANGSFGDRAANALGHAAVGCASAAASGGDCGKGASGAFVGAVGTNFVGGGFVTTTVFGGLGSMAAGGGFGEGAKMAAAGYLFNACMHAADCWADAQRQVMQVWTDTYVVAAKTTAAIFGVIAMAPAAPEVAVVTAPLRTDAIGATIVKWGTGQGEADVALTVQRTGEISKRAVQDMIDQGLTKDWVSGQLTKYTKAYEDGINGLKNTLKNQQLIPRTELMKKILQNWPQ